MQGRYNVDSFDNRSEYHVAHLLNHFVTKSMPWDKFLVYADDKTKREYLKLLAEEEAGIMYAQTVLNTISQSDAEWRRERDYIDIANTEATIRYEAEQKGYAAGEKRGIQQGLLRGEQKKAVEDARSFYANGASIELIAKSLNMTESQVCEIVKTSVSFKA